MVADTAKAYCRQELMPRVTAANRSEIFDRAIMTEFGELGLLVRARLSMHRQAFALSILGGLLANYQTLALAFGGLPNTLAPN